MTTGRSLVRPAATVTRILITRLATRPLAWCSLACVLLLAPGISLVTPPGILRVASAESSAAVLRVATFLGIAWGVILSCEHVWVLQRLSPAGRFAGESATLVIVGACFAFAASIFDAVGHTLPPAPSVMGAGLALVNLAALGSLLIQLRWRAHPTACAFAALAFLLPAAFPLGSQGHAVLDSASWIAQHLSTAPANSDKALLDPSSFAPGAALFLVAYLLSRSARR